MEQLRDIEEHLSFDEIMKEVDNESYCNPYVNALEHKVNSGISQISYDKVLLQDDEIIVYAVPANSFTEKEKTIGYERGYSGASMRVAKGLTIHAGGSKGAPIRKMVRDYHNGDFIITNKRIIFFSIHSGFEFKLEKLTSISSEYYDTYTFQSGRTVKNIEFDHEVFLNVRIAIEHVTTKGIDGKNLPEGRLVLKQRIEDISTALSMRDYTEFNDQIIDRASILSKEFRPPEDSENILDILWPGNVKELVNHLAWMGEYRNYNYREKNRLGFNHMITAIMEALNEIRKLDFVHFYDEDHVELLSDREFLEKYGFIKDINLERDIFPLLKEELIRLFTIASYVRSVYTVSEITRQLNEEVTEYDDEVVANDLDFFLNETKNKWIKKTDSVENYVTTAAQYFLKNYNIKQDVRGRKSYPKSYVQIEGSRYHYTSIEDKSLIDFKEENSYKEFEDEISTFSNFGIIKGEFIRAIEGYLKQYLKYLSRFIKMHYKLKTDYFLLENKEEMVNKVFNDFESSLPDNWIVMKNAGAYDTKIDIVVINGSGVFTFYVVNNFNDQLSKDIISNSVRSQLTLKEYLFEKLPNKGGFLRKKMDIDWNEAVRGVVYVPNEELDISEDPTYTVISPKQLMPFFHEYSGSLLDKKSMNAVKESLFSARRREFKQEYPMHYTEGYNKDLLTTLERGSRPFILKYLHLLNGTNELMNLGHELTYYPILENENGEDELAFAKAKECEYAISDFLSEDAIDYDAVEKDEYLQFVKEILNLDSNLLF